MTIDIKDLTGYLFDRQRYIENKLHGKKLLSADDVNAIAKLDELFSCLKIPQHFAINILVVENDPKYLLKNGLIELHKHFPNIKFYLINNAFKELKQCLYQGKKTDISNFTVKTQLGCDEKKVFTYANDFDLDQIDLILQDIFLEKDGVSGFDLSELYFSLAPQAMVFFLTSMDVETLSAYGYDRKVDRIVGKKRLKGVMKYYYERFHELYGPLLWPVFLNAKPTEGGTPKLTDKESVRRLLGNIRSWINEPGILFHGFAVPEMVDHQYRHTSGLWRMTNSILGTFAERAKLNISDEEIILLSLAIWLHDIGHRGDKHHDKPMDIREHHGSLSESLMLTYCEALGIEWLRDFCHVNKGENCKGLSNRNKKSGCNNNSDICPLRKIGLMCRYHQSTAPLKENKLAGLILNMKRPSPYCIVGIKENGAEITEPYNTQIDTWLSTTKDFGWFSFDIRTLDEFNNGGLINLAGLLRWLDALHTHSEKVGSSTQLKSFLAYLQMRKDYCKEKTKEIKDLLDNTDAGTEAYLKLLAELMKLDSYSQLLDVQWIHLWRSAAVKDIEGEWFWDGNGCWAFRVVFDLFEKDPLDAFHEMEEVKKELKKELKKSLKKGITEFHELWKEHVGEEVINSELESQTEYKEEAGKTIKLPPYYENYFREVDLSYWYRSGGSKAKQIIVKTKKSEEISVEPINEAAIEKNRGLIIDCDPGCDDALALLLAVRGDKSPYGEIHICTVAGNVPVERTTHNAKKIATVALHELENIPSVKIYKGSAVSFMGKSPNVTSVHGRDGLGEVPHKLYPPVEKPEVTMEEKSAVEFLKDFKGNSNGEKYDLVCTGPLTNLATALSLSAEPKELLNMFDKIVIMGGAFNHRGNITPTAEFNFFFDPVAVQILLDTIKKDESESLFNKIVFVPLNITERVQFNMEKINKDASIQNPVGQWTLCMLQKYFYFHALSAKELENTCAQFECEHKDGEVCKFKEVTYEDIREKIKQANLIGKSGIKQMPRFCYLHDPLAVWYAINSANKYREEAYIKIHTDNDEMRGTIITLDAKDSKAYTKGTKVKYLSSPTKVALADVQSFKEMLLKACGLKTAVS